jgi:hypothetical protein
LPLPLKRKRARPRHYNYNSKYSGGKRYRATYFRHFRAERKALSLIENTYSMKDCRANDRINRNLYYHVIPHLAKYLWFPPDRERLINVEHSLYDDLLIRTYRKSLSRKAPDRIRLWEFRQPSVSIETQQKLYRAIA